MIVFLSVAFMSVNTVGAAPVVSNSAITLASSTNVLTDVSGSVDLKDGSNAAATADITLTASDGVFANGLSTVSGSGVSTLAFTWTSPSISFLETQLNVTFTATISGTADFVIYDSIIVSHEDNIAIVNSEKNIPTVMTSGVEYELTTLVKDINLDTSSDIQVTYTADFGTFDEAIGLSSSGGWFNTTFTAPAVDTTVNYILVTISILVEASNTISLSLPDTIVNVTKSSSTVLTATPSYPTEILTGQSTDIDIRVLAGLSPAFNGIVTLGVTNGSFSGGVELISIDINETGYASVLWNTPVTYDNITVTFSYDAYYLDLNVSGSFDIEVTVKIIDIGLYYTLEKASVLQNETNQITIYVNDTDTSLYLEGVSVLFSAGVGVFNNGASDYTAITDSNGRVTATFDASGVDLPFESQKAVITVSVNSPVITFTEIEFNFTLIRVPPVFDFTATGSVDKITYGENVTITLHADKNNVAYTNASFYIFTTGGTFTNNESSIRERADVNGDLIIEWYSYSLSITEESVIYITVELVNSGLAVKTLEISISPSSDVSPVSIVTNNAIQDALSDPTMIGSIIAALIAIGAGGFIIFKKMNVAV